MDIGMLWFDNDPKTDFSSKVERAAHYYHSKYGRSPTLCYVNPLMLPGMEIEQQAQERIKIKTAGVEIRPAQTVLPNHFWIGVNGLGAA